MIKYSTSLALVILFLLAPARIAVSKGTQGITAEQARIQIVKIGVGEKAKATITLRDGSKVKGYITRADDNDFVIRDRKTDSPTTIRYADVAKVDKNSGHSTARNLAIGIGIGVGAFLLVLGIAIARLD